MCFFKPFYTCVSSYIGEGLQQGLPGGPILGAARRPHFWANRSLRDRSNGSLRDHGHLGIHAHLRITFTDHLGITFIDDGVGRGGG